jgi:hypothetical protein
MVLSFNTCLFVLVLPFAFHAVDATVSNVSLGDAEKYVILAKTGISTVPTSTITGNIAVSPIGTAAMTGFSFTLGSDGELSKSTQVVGGAHQAYAPDLGTRNLTKAVLAMGEAYKEAEKRVTSSGMLNLNAGKLNGVTLKTGVYTFTTNVELTGDITFAGGASDIFVIQTTGDLLQSANYQVTLAENALAENIFWQVAGEVTVGAGAHMEGILLAKAAVTFVTGSSLNGRILSQTRVNLQMATITEPSPSSE